MKSHTYEQSVTLEVENPLFSRTVSSVTSQFLQEERLLQSPIFRIINEVKGTLIIDEADFKFSDMTSNSKDTQHWIPKGMAVLRS